MIVTVDTGGTKTLVTAFNQRGEPQHEVRFPTPTNSDKYIEYLLEALLLRYNKEEIKAIVIAVPGIIKQNKVVWCGNLPWEGVDIASAVAKHYPCPIWLENDANLAGLAEANVIHPTPELCLYVTVSTGIGTGIIINGKLQPALSGSEGGHMVVEYEGALHTWESFASGKAVHEKYGKYAYEIQDEATWQHIAKRIGLGLVALLPALQPDTVIMGGSVGTHYGRFSKYLNSYLDEKLPEHIIRPRILQAKHPQEAVIYGCYYYGTHQLARA